MEQVYIWLATTVFGVLVWAIRLEGRVNMSDQKDLALKELIDSKFDAINDRLDRIDRSLNGHLRKD